LERVQISDSSLHLGQSIFAIQGQVTPEQGIDLTLAADSVTTADITELLATPASLPMIEGLALELHYTRDLRGASAALVTGKVNSAGFKLGSVQTQDIEGRFQYDNGVINFTELSAKILGATWTGQCRLDTSGPDLAYQIEGSWKGVDLAQLAGLTSQLAGPGEMRLKVEGVVSGSDWLQQLRGTGHFSITSPKLGALRPFEAVFNGPAWQLVERVPGAIDRHFLGKLSSLDDQLRAVSAAFEFKGWGIQVTKLELQYPNASVRLTGAMDWEAQLKWSGYLSVQSDFVSALLLDPQLQDLLLLHRRELKVPLDLTGTLQDPTISGPEEFLTRRFQDYLRVEERNQVH